MKSMAYHPTVVLVSDSLASESAGDMTASIVLVNKTDTVFDVDMWKEK